MHQLFTTSDGSHSVQLRESGVSFHSKHGAITESGHVYINAALRHVAASTRDISILEMGFGSGLNCLLTYTVAAEQALTVSYESFEKFPLESEYYQQLNFTDRLSRPDLQKLFLTMHECAWNTPVKISEQFTLYKRSADISDATFDGKYNLVYWDAFDPQTQPHLWSPEIFKKLRRQMHAGGTLVTYSSKVSVRRALQAAGFEVVKLPGPPGKREITRATAV